jgi:TPR repeat protein
MRACSYLGYLCAKGLGGEHDLQKARVVYQKACDQGILSSCASLGTLYQDAGNNEEAIKNFQKACNGGVVEACELLRGIQ